MFGKPYATTRRRGGRRPLLPIPKETKAGTHKQNQTERQEEFGTTIGCNRKKKSLGRARNTKRTPRTHSEKQKINDPVVFFGRKGQHATREPQRRKEKTMRGRGQSKRRRPHQRGQIGRLISLSVPKQRTLPRRALSFDWKAEERP